VRRRGTLESYF